MTRCKKHDRLNCYDSSCKDDNAGRVGMDLDGDLAIGIGGGLTIDPSDGSLGMQIAPGISVDFDGGGSDSDGGGGDFGGGGASGDF